MPNPQLDLTSLIKLAWFTLGSPGVVEVAMRGTADAAVLDLQHGLWDRMSAYTAVKAAAPRPVLLRVADNSAIEISRGLDTGGAGVIVPMVETPDEAVQAVAHANFPPIGHRSAGGVRLQARGFQYAASGATTLLGVMIETAAGVHNARGIAAVAGVDFIFIGPGDLGLSLGKNGDLEGSLAGILAACREAGKPCGIYTPTRAASETRSRQGFSITAVADDVSAIMSAFAVPG
ncbi:HpcH/HpaI aldolase family protein [Sphingobium boeckii]|uniref:2-dehydro-3-deoxyglucarate aldolase/4-hydroxy-2-oxoheptanedioate aldolase n=1 Tax=Sphingobium boeckii TaxID=1082345 RepID=A0A7W9EEF6_9SPHN|nr:aldolase/citrate lyase family protein [Sphingobium boeckii]MBB5684950.1 2-dehydro-3-deoxyglucarate aldolase/4-hydroxy-2-oxoheptanedioate aldolase [Sphingobium boeckii]